MPIKATDHCSLPVMPQGTVIPYLQDAKRVWVRGSNGWHTVEVETGECSCVGWQYRRQCRHQDDARSFLDAQKSLQSASPIAVAREMKRVTGQPAVPRVSELTEAEIRAIFADGVAA